MDQRLTRDVERLCTDLTALVPSMVKPVVDLLWFSAQLWRLLGARGTGVLYLYAVAGFAVLRMVTPDFGKLAEKVRLPGPEASESAHAGLMSVCSWSSAQLCTLAAGQACASRVMQGHILSQCCPCRAYMWRMRPFQDASPAVEAQQGLFQKQMP